MWQTQAVRIPAWNKSDTVYSYIPSSVASETCSEIAAVDDCQMVEANETLINKTSTDLTKTAAWMSAAHATGHRLVKSQQQQLQHQQQQLRLLHVTVT